MNPFKKVTAAMRAGSVDAETSTYWTTPWAWRDAGGCYVGHNRQVWLYRQVTVNPLQWEDPNTRLGLGSPLANMLAELGATAKDMMGGMRSLSRNREIHILSVTYETEAKAPEGTPPDLQEYLDSTLNFLVPTKALLIGVRLRSSIVPTSSSKTSPLSQVKDMMVKALGEESPDLDSYQKDRELVEGILSRNGGGTVPTRDVLAQLESWYNLGRGPDASIVESKDVLYVDEGDTLELSALMRFDNPVMYAPDAQWALDAQSHPAGPSVISIRGELEPSSVSRKRARGSQRKVLANMEEEAVTGDLERAEQSETFALAKEVENFIRSGREPLITACSIIMVRQVNGDVNETYVDELRNTYGIEMTPLVHRQLDGLDETLPCSSKRVNPHLQDVSVSMLAYAGLQGFSNLGDGTGIFTGLVDPDYTPCYLNPLGAPAADLPPAMAICGDAGSGKAITVLTPIPTPSGWTRMGELSIGDEVLGRDGKPCRVTYLADINESPELYDIYLSDGQVIRACVDHQWIVANKRERRLPTTAPRLAAITNHEAAHQLAARHERLALDVGADAFMTTKQLTDFLGEILPTAPWRSDLDGVLRQEGLRSERRPVPVTWAASTANPQKLTPSMTYPVQMAIEACRDRWSTQTAPGWKSQSAQRVTICDDLLASTDPKERAGSTNIARRLLAAGAQTRSPLKTFARQVAVILTEADVPGTPGMIEIDHPAHNGYTASVERDVWSVRDALLILAARLRRQYQLRPASDVVERVLTTGDLLTEGVLTPGGASNFAIRVTEALDLPEADLPLDPYVLGAWLGDGSTGTGHIASATAASCVDPQTGISDQTYLLDRLAIAGYSPHVLPSAPTLMVSVPGLQTQLRAGGVLRNKHIPMTYLRASAAQRLELLRGLMDTDGFIDEFGACEFALCNEGLATEALELIRSLGIKTAMHVSDAMITEDDPDNPGQKRRRKTGLRYRMTFTTSTQVFSLPRKARRVPASVRGTQEWLYITDIVAVPTEPARCIQVDSPDHSYLVAGFVPSHNTWLCQLIATQAALAGMQVVFINPKGYDSLAPFAELTGGVVVSMSKLEEEGGYFDPFSYAEPETAAEIATTHILSVLGTSGGFTQSQELKLGSGLKRGAIAGARCVGDALTYVEDDSVVTMVMEQVEASTTFALGIGTAPKPARAMHRGITLIEFDRKLDLPESSKAAVSHTRAERIALAAIRLVTRASLEMLASAKGGVLIVDEAWTFLSQSEGLAALQQIGREGRSLNILPIFATQRVADLIKEGVDMEGYLSRVFVMKLTEEREARAALQLCGLEATPERIAWLRQAGPRRGENGQPSRPALALHRDLKNRHSALMIGPVPPAAAEAFSTNPAERAARLATQQLATRVTDTSPDYPREAPRQE